MLTCGLSESSRKESPKPIDPLGGFNSKSSPVSEASCTPNQWRVMLVNVSIDMLNCLTSGAEQLGGGVGGRGVGVRVMSTQEDIPPLGSGISKKGSGG